MIYVLLNGDHRFTVDRYLASYGRRLLSTIQPIAYSRILGIAAPRPGVYLFTDMERLTDTQLAQAQALWEALQRREDCRTCNHPTRSLRRRELLNALHAQGINTFQAHPADVDPTRVRFPVFLRRANEHDGPQSSLLQDAGQLAGALESMRLKGARLEDWLVVEFCDTADADGWYRKYSAFRVGERIIPRHVFVGRAWGLKHCESVDPAHLREETAYLEANPHREELMRFFTIARIEYGRMDYGLRQGRIQAWEINSNPSLPWHDSYAGAVRRNIHRSGSDQLAIAWQELERGLPSQSGYPTEYLRTLRWVAAAMWHAYRPPVFRRGVCRKKHNPLSGSR